LEGEDSYNAQRMKTSSFKVFEEVIPELMKYPLYSEFLFPKLDDGKNLVS